MGGKSRRNAEARWPRILSKLEANAHVLAESGGITTQVTAWGQNVRVVRFFVREGGIVRHKAIYIGSDPELVRRAEEWLAHLRLPRDLAAEVADCAELAASVR